MLNVITQAQLAISALSQLLAFLPAAQHPRLRPVLGHIGAALQAGAELASALPDLAQHLQDLRARVEAISQRPGGLEDADLDAALAHLQNASDIFRSTIANRRSLS